ncbi:NAD-dependent epimerase/dehydratase family protein [Yoonia sp.]|uniref:NAD-dependent epimerase/dehydratase family protein n=1 Tax=Yoonia sp. TaxID=2212373 RepID=UPI002FD8ED17
MNVLITGAAGHLGRKLFDHLAAQGGCHVTGIDLREVEETNIHTADLAVGTDWASHLIGVDVVVHLAGDSSPAATWESCQRNNTLITSALLHHAAAAGVRRVILASSNWVLADRRFAKGKLTSQTVPCPTTPYGVSKVVCEQMGAYYSRCHGLSVICLRIGWNQRGPVNLPGPHMAMGRWGQEMWLSDRDFLQGMQAAMTARNVDFAILNLMSDNPGMRWDIAETMAVIGYQPQDGWRADMPAMAGPKSKVRAFFEHSLRNFSRKHLSGW